MLTNVIYNPKIWASVADWSVGPPSKRTATTAPNYTGESQELHRELKEAPPHKDRLNDSTCLALETTFAAPCVNGWPRWFCQPIRKPATMPLFHDVDADCLGKSTLRKSHNSLGLWSVWISSCNCCIHVNSENVTKHVKDFMKRKLCVYVCSSCF